MTVALLYGGQSSEHEVSLVSAAGVLRAIDSRGDYDVVLIGITKEGRWFRQDTDQQRAAVAAGKALSVENDTDEVVVVPGRGLAVTPAPSTILPISCAFPVLHGSFGEDGTLQGLLEMAHIPYVGSGVVGSSVGMDKLRSKQLWEHHGLPVVPYFSVRISATDAPHGHTAIVDRIESSFGFPVFVKPNAAGSSVGVSKVHNRDELDEAIRLATAIDPVILVEEAMPVREIETSVLGTAEIRSFPPGEVIPNHEFYDYNAKYEDPDGARLVIPAEIDTAIAEEIQRVAVAAFRAVDGAGFARVDCFLHRETSAIYLNEINTIPGFTPISMYPKMVEAGGVPYRDLVGLLIELALQR